MEHPPGKRTHMEHAMIRFWEGNCNQGSELAIAQLEDKICSLSLKFSSDMQEVKDFSFATTKPKIFKRQKDQKDLSLKREL